jgi:transcriptional regulator with XRE-family HTH domain
VVTNGDDAMGSPEPRASDREGLGPFLLDVRNGKRLSLRDVERETNGQIKSGYLSQLERGQIARPSPRILWILGNAYGLDYDHLLSLANYEMLPSTARPKASALRGISLKAIAELDDDDRKLVRDFVEMLVARHKTTEIPP